MEDPYGTIYYSYVCQIAAIKDWEAMCMRPCPEKMARFHNYNKEKVQQAFSIMITEGWGQFQSNKVIRQFLTIAKFYCDQKDQGNDESS